MAITLTVDFTGSPTEQDIRGAKRIIRLENERRAADLDENGDPLLPPLPDSTSAELKSSYLGLLEAIITNAHASYIKQDDAASVEEAKTLWQSATNAQRQAAIAAMGG